MSFSKSKGSKEIIKTQKISKKKKHKRKLKHSEYKKK
jgi:hypothetical protein